MYIFGTLAVRFRSHFLAQELKSSSIVVVLQTKGCFQIAMQSDLRTILSKAGLNEKVIEHLETEGCNTIELCSDWFNAPTEITELVNDSAVEQPIRKAQSAMLKGVVRQLQAKVARATKRLAEGLSAEHEDEALGAEHHKDMMTTAQTFWKWPRFDARSVCGDNQMAKMRRDYQSHQPTLLILMKLKTAAGDLITWLDLLEVFITSSAVAGCFDVSLRPDGATSGPEKVAKYFN